jgi:tripartite-type tricarboxylate transporter receptor subunit TctC
LAKPITQQRGNFESASHGLRGTLVALLSLCCIAQAVQAQVGVVSGASANAVDPTPWPEKPLRLVVPFVTGGAADSAARILAPVLHKKLGQSVIVENRPGAGAAIGTAAVAAARPDGYTLLMGSASNAIGNLLYKNLPYVFARDLEPVLLVAEVPGVMVVPRSLPVQDLADFLAYAKAHPGEVTYGSPGVGTSVHLAGELLESMTGVSMLHVPYKGAAPAMTDLLGARLQVMFPALSAAQVHIKAGALRVLAVTTAQRSTLAPQIPTIAELGLPGYEVGGWIGIFAPTGLEATVSARLQTVLTETLKESEILQTFLSAGIEPTPDTAQVLRARVQTDAARWEKLIQIKRIELQ